MKTKNILLSGFLFALLSTSCNGFLEEDPKGQLTPSTFFSSQEELDMSTYALYQKVCLLQTNTNPTIPNWQGDDLTSNPGSNKQAYAEVDAKQTQYYASAAEQAKAVIDGVKKGEYEYILEPEYKYVYAPSHNYTNETVVGINYSRDFVWSEDSQMTSSNLFESLGGWGDGWGEIKFWKEFPAGPRKDATYNPKILKNNAAGSPLVDWWDESIPEQHPMYCIFTIGEDGGDYDYTQPANSAWMTNDHRHRLIRYSEVLLWYAESQARADGTPNAMAYECINKVRVRAGLDPLQQGMSGEAFADAALAEHGWEVAGYWVALVTRRDDQMRMEMLEHTFNERKANEPIEVAPGVMRKNQIEIPASATWQGEKSIYLPYPATDTQLNPNLKR